MLICCASIQQLERILEHAPEKGCAPSLVLSDSKELGISDSLSLGPPGPPRDLSVFKGQRASAKVTRSQLRIDTCLPISARIPFI